MSKGYSGLYEGTKGGSGGNGNSSSGGSSLTGNAEVSADSLTPVVTYAKDGTKLVNGFPAKVHEGKQGKHIPGHNNYREGRSKLTISMSEADKLIREKGGTGKMVAHNSNRERVDFGIVIGFYVDNETGTSLPTSKGIIHYSKSGAHIVPSYPN